MRKINYPLIVSDFDGTLVDRDANISKRNKEAIADYLAAGGVFAISTGRLPAGILPRVEELGLKGIVCCAQGALILDIETKACLLSGRMPLRSALSVCKRLEELDLHIHAYDLWEYYSNMDDDPLKLYQRLTQTQATIVTDRPLSTFMEEQNLAPYKLLAMAEPAYCDKLMEMLIKENYEGCEVTKSANFLVEVTQKAYSKGTAVEFLANRYGVPLEKTIAIGDQRNDIPMIERAGLGIAVANADAALKGRAKLVLDKTNEESAVADIIEKYGFYEEN